MIHNFDALIIAQNYLNAKHFQNDAVKSWRELAATSLQMANAIRQRYNVTEHGEDNPYETALEMFADIRRGNFKVSTANCEHPIWTTRENVAFRIVHDVCGHFKTGGLFDWDGELKACHAHRQLLSASANIALEMECIGQTAFGVVNGTFIEQKTSYLR